MDKAEKVEEEKILDSYSFDAEGINVIIRVTKNQLDFVPTYNIQIPGLAEGTKIILNTLIKGELITEVRLDITEIVDPKQAAAVKKKFEEKASVVVARHFPALQEDVKRVLACYLMQNTLGLGELEMPMHDEMLEEIAIVGSGSPVWIYHKKHGWCKTNIQIKSEEAIYDYASTIGRRIGRQINVLNPLMDAHLSGGERVNATLGPISACGNTITIRKFSKNPWTIPVLIANKTITPEVASLVWVCIQNELSLLVSGSTGSGKTSFLNALACLFPPNHRIVSIEDTRELTLPQFLQWIPMNTREPNAEGKGEITMLDLLVNALRQRPDRLVVGEVRRQREAEILFEAMHTGHSVYSTIHADNALETVSRLTTPPINVPKNVLGSLAGIIVQLRHRRLGIRRTLEFAEMHRDGEPSIIYRWDVKSDSMKEVGELYSLVETLELYAGLTLKEIKEDMEEKSSVLNWMVMNKYWDVDTVGRIVGNYYSSPSEIMDLVKKRARLGE